MGAGSFVPKQQNWRWMQNDAAEPTLAYANENTTFTLSNNGDILRLRVTIAETGAKAARSVDLKFQWSTDNSAFNTPGAASDWNYADGLATQGNTVTTNKLSDTTGKGEYVEASGGASTFDFVASTSYEFDFTITPGSSVSGNTLYYFRFLINDAEVVLNTGETHPNCTTTTSAEEKSGTAVISGNGSQSGSVKKGGIASGLISGAGALIVAATIGLFGIASISGGGSQSGTVQKAAVVSGAISGGGSITATGSAGAEEYSGTAAISGGGSQSASGIKSISSTGVISGSGSLAVSGKAGLKQVATISGGGSQSATVSKAASVSAVLSGNGSVIASIETGRSKTLAISGGGTSTVTPTANHIGSGTIAGGGSTSGSETTNRKVPATLSATGSLSGMVTKATSGNGIVSGNGSITATGTSGGSSKAPAISGLSTATTIAT